MLLSRTPLQWLLSGNEILSGCLISGVDLYCTFGGGLYEGFHSMQDLNFSDDHFMGAESSESWEVSLVHCSDDLPVNVPLHRFAV